MNETKRVVLITGASSGIGKSCAAYLAARGFRVYGTSRRVTSDEELVDGGSHSYSLIPMNVDDEASVRRGIDWILAREGRLDVAVNNAGCGISGSVEDSSMDEIRALFETNFFGVVRVCQAALPIMREQGSGYIVNMSSLGGRVAQPFQAFYGASKFAVEGFTEALRMEVASLGIRVCLIEPGDLSTGFTGSRRYVARAESQPAYAESFRMCMRVIEADETGGASPEIVAPLLHRIITNPSPRLRHPVGAVFQKAIAAIKYVLPGRLFEWGLRKYYRVP